MIRRTGGKIVAGILSAAIIAVLIPGASDVRAAEAIWYEAAEYNTDYDVALSYDGIKDKGLEYTAIKDGYIQLEYTVAEIPNQKPSMTMRDEYGLAYYNVTGLTAGYHIMPKVAVAKGQKYYLKWSLLTFSSADIASIKWNFKYTESSDWETENNDTVEAADKLNAGKAKYGSLNSNVFGEGDSLDYYRFTLKKAKKVTFNVGLSSVENKYDENSLNWTFTLYDKKGNKCKLADTSIATKKSVYLKKGTYYVCVSRIGLSSQSIYKVKYTAKNFKKKTVTDAFGNKIKNK